jgi:hypothetical protein
VYALATRLEVNDVAAFASTQLHSPPLESYSPEALDILPNIKSLQLLYILHAHRKERFHEILSDEPLFPHGYGKCTVKHHAQKAEEAWRTQKRYLLSMGRIHAGTNLAAEMVAVLRELGSCETCLKAYNAAIGMLEVCSMKLKMRLSLTTMQYKSRKVPQSISKLPSQKTTEHNVQSGSSVQ